jgi:hypothetical protein
MLAHVVESAASRIAAVRGGADERQVSRAVVVKVQAIYISAE